MTGGTENVKAKKTKQKEDKNEMRAQGRETAHSSEEEAVGQECTCNIPGSS